QEEFADRFSACNGNIVFTGRGGNQYDMEKEEYIDQHGHMKEKKTFIKSGVKMKVASETPFEPDLNVWMDQEQEFLDGALTVWRTALVLKDRNDTATGLDGKLFKQPSYEDFRPLVTFLLSVPVSAVVGQTSEDNLAPAEDFGWHAKKTEREIEVEKIKALFDRYGFGTSKDDKQLKVLILDRCFGTASATEIDKFDAENLRLGREHMSLLLEALWKIGAENRVLEFENIVIAPTQAATNQGTI
ncbi:MAG: hypothetical protein MN733_14070, partial [Nitrososphaera sp.]|nr:hypothetical protein [Nitrososphaera sp.]